MRTHIPLTVAGWLSGHAAGIGRQRESRTVDHLEARVRPAVERDQVPPVAVPGDPSEDACIRMCM